MLDPASATPTNGTPRTNKSWQTRRANAAKAHAAAPPPEVPTPPAKVASKPRSHRSAAALPPAAAALHIRLEQVLALAVALAALAPEDRALLAGLEKS